MSHPDLPLALRAARDAGAIVRAGFGHPHELAFKGADQPVTETDRAADRFLHSSLLGERPGYGWLSEESQAEVAPRGRPTWIVDPLDGTINFLEGRPEFAVCIALVEGGTPVLGVVYNPMTDELYHGVRGEGAWKNGAPIRAAEWPRGSPRLLVSWAERERGAFRSLAPAWTLSTLGSTALKMAWVAEGRADAYLSLGSKRIWDVCAGRVLVEAAGGSVASGAGIPFGALERPDPIAGLIVVGRAGAGQIEQLARLGRVEAPVEEPEEGP